MKDTSYNLVMSAMFNGRKGARPWEIPRPLFAMALWMPPVFHFQRHIWMPMPWPI